MVIRRASHVLLIQRYPWLAFIPWTFLLGSGLAEAHVGFHRIGSFADGIIHPFTGWDHTLAMAALGVWVSQGYVRYHGLFLLSFALGLAAPGVAAIAGFSHLFLEAALSGSILFLGLLMTKVVRLSLGMTFAIICMSLFLHGYLHGAEVHGTVSPNSYLIGVGVGTVVLYVGGITAGLCVKHFGNGQILRVIGSGLIIMGITRLIQGWYVVALAGPFLGLLSTHN
jgi:urease accessory protein